MLYEKISKIICVGWILFFNIISVIKINYLKFIYYINVLLRLSLLKKSGEEEWKKRVFKLVEF